MERPTAMMHQQQGRTQKKENADKEHWQCTMILLPPHPATGSVCTQILLSSMAAASNAVSCIHYHGDLVPIHRLRQAIPAPPAPYVIIVLPFGYF